MAQFIRIPTTFDEAYESGLQQVSQIVYHLERVIEIYWHTGSHRVFVQDNGEWFYLYSPDIPNLTLKQTIEGLGYAGEKIRVIWAVDDLENEVLSMTVQNAPLNQLAIYATEADIPNEPPQGQFPMVVGSGNQNAQPIYLPNQLTFVIHNVEDSVEDPIEIPNEPPL
jgi:hypothetical protein